MLDLLHVTMTSARTKERKKIMNIVPTIYSILFHGMGHKFKTATIHHCISYMITGRKIKGWEHGEEGKGVDEEDEG